MDRTRKQLSGTPAQRFLQPMDWRERAQSGHLGTRAAHAGVVRPATPTGTAASTAQRGCVPGGAGGRTWREVPSLVLAMHRAVLGQWLPLLAPAFWNGRGSGSGMMI